MGRVPTWFVIAILSLSGGTAIANEPTFRDIEYASVGPHRLRLDLYLPEDRSRPVPLVVWVHGGAWRAGSKDDVPVQRWLHHGLAIASVEYRLSTQARFPAQIHDIKAAIRWARTNAQQYQIDPDHVIVAGSSAGGHLAALVGVSNGLESLEGDVGEFRTTSSDVQAIVSFYGASNLQTILSQSTAHGLSVRVPALKLLLGGLPDEFPELAKMASPVAHVDAADPPLWLIHGDADPQMPIEQSYELQRGYDARKLDVDFEIVSGGKHGGEGFFTDHQLDRIARELLPPSP